MLKEFIEWIVYSLIGLDSSSHLVKSLVFFVYDSAKIMLLLFAMIFIISFARTYIPLSKFRKFLKKAPLGVSNFFASVFGAITPFCSCSSIPIFLSFVKAKTPLGITFSFLITSPLVNEYLVVLMFGLFGWKITVAYIFFGILIGVVAGIILEKMNLEKFIEKDIYEDSKVADLKYKTFNERLLYGYFEAMDMLRKLWLWIFVGVGIGAVIHNFVPEAFVDTVVSSGGIFTVPLAVMLGVPMYGSCAAIVPIAVALFEKGFPLGTSLAFMMSTSALSLPQAVILRRAMNLKLIMIFFGVVSIGIIIVGYLFNLLQVFLI